jgi:hypothetical protein
MKSKVYLVFFGSEEKHGQTSPQILEFDGEVHLDEWMKRGGEDYLERIRENDGELHGGWPTWHTVSPGKNGDPDNLLDDWLQHGKTTY